MRKQANKSLKIEFESQNCNLQSLDNKTLAASLRARATFFNDTHENARALALVHTQHDAAQKRKLFVTRARKCKIANFFPLPRYNRRSRSRATFFFWLKLRITLKVCDASLSILGYKIASASLRVLRNI